jgi:hypothetical protein
MHTSELLSGYALSRYIEAGKARSRRLRAYGLERARYPLNQWDLNIFVTPILNLVK